MRTYIWIWTLLSITKQSFVLVAAIGWGILEVFFASFCLCLFFLWWVYRASITRKKVGLRTVMMWKQTGLCEAERLLRVDSRTLAAKLALPDLLKPLASLFPLEETSTALDTQHHCNSVQSPSLEASRVCSKISLKQGCISACEPVHSLACLSLQGDTLGGWLLSVLLGEPFPRGLRVYFHPWRKLFSWSQVRRHTGLPALTHSRSPAASPVWQVWDITPFVKP